MTEGWIETVAVDELQGAALDWAYEEARGGRMDPRDIKLGEEGVLICLNDDVNYGWYFYAPRYANREKALALIREKNGDRVRIPIEAARILKPVHTVFPGKVCPCGAC